MQIIIKEGDFLNLSNIFHRVFKGRYKYIKYYAIFILFSFSEIIVGINYPQYERVGTPVVLIVGGYFTILFMMHYYDLMYKLKNINAKVCVDKKIYSIFNRKKLIGCVIRATNGKDMKVLKVYFDTQFRYNDLIEVQNKYIDIYYMKYSKVVVDITNIL
ncbi:hypothetical protein [Clostridium intestinale]|uniref:Uncharacterized protein n=1 Tax=Clostridium intestinale DSM 6191 TaxID=1121320 RepID=A0A1M5V1C9_9CLOT|nr:hypothetical protein [Clostridium intestinale]SHH68944.1 hypothetical protein SAMN02745941_00722 [Clostridium intestinale DSM 6191]